MADEEHESWLHRDVESLLARFEQAWQPALDAGADPPLLAVYSVEALKLGEPAQRQEALRELVKVDLEYRWRLWKNRGANLQATRLSISDGDPDDIPETPLVEDYLRRIPELENSVALVCEEFRVRHRFGDRPPRDDFLDRFASFSHDLPEQLALVQSELAGQRAAAPGEAGEIQRDDTIASAAAPPCSQEPQPAEPPAGKRPAQPLPRNPLLDSDSRSLPATVGRYQVQSVLGEGAFGAVYLARDPDLDRLVAVKVPHAERFSNDDAVELFLREAQMSAQLRHASTVKVYDVGREGASCYIVMEYIEGPTLRDLARQRALALTEIAKLMSAVGEALHEAHKLGLVHRDLKPGNILIDREGVPHVADFGLAVRESDQRSRAGEVSGTPAYMSPEQVRGETHRLDGRCDIWAMGAMLYELTTGRKPFDGSSVYEVFDEIKHREPKPPRQIDDTIPASIERITLACLAKNVAERYSTARDVADDLRRSLETSLARMEASYGASAARSSSGVPMGPANWRGESSSQSSGARTFPRASGRLIGREAEKETLSSWLTSDETSLATITGMAGIGKSRLAQELGSTLMPRFPGGCWWCDLNSASNADDVAHAVLAAFEIPPRDDGTAVDIVGAILELRRPLMLIFDQCDMALAALAEIVETWRRVAPQLTCLLTARSPLAAEGEQQFELDALPAPSLGEGATLDLVAVEAVLAVQMFVDRATHADRHFTLDESTCRDVAEICAHLEGIPLALELAAARIKVLKPAQMLKKIDRKFQLLSSSRRDVPARQRTLSGAIDLSYEQLTDWERAAFEQSCIFTGGFFLDAAEAVIDLEEFPDAPLAMDAVQSLREKSLLRVSDEQHELRFDMYGSIREYGNERRKKRAAAEAEQALRRRFTEYLVEYAEDWKDRIPSAEGPEALDRLMLERDNILSAVDWAVANRAHDLAAQAILAVHAAVNVRGGLADRVARLQQPLIGANDELRATLHTAISEAQRGLGDWTAAQTSAEEAVAIADKLGDSPLVVAAYRQQAEMLRVRGQTDDAMQAYSQAEAIGRRVDAPHQLARTIASRGFAAWQQGKSDETLAAYDEADQLARSIGDDALLGGISRQRGHVHMQRGNFAEAEECFLEAETIARRRGDKRTLHLATSSRGMALAEQGRYDEALACYNESERITRQLGEKRGIATNQGNRGLALADRGDYAEALDCFDRAEALNRELGNRSGQALNLGNRGVVLAKLGKHDEAVAAIEQANALHEELGNKYQQAVCRGDLGAVHFKQGAFSQAREELLQALDALETLQAVKTPDGFLYLAALAATLQATEESQAAASTSDKALALAEELKIDGQHPRVRVREAFVGLKDSG